MAISKQYSKQSKRMLMKGILIVFLGWLILLVWVLSLWGVLGFDKAYLFLQTLAKQQATDISELPVGSILESLHEWESKLLSPKLVNQLHKTQVLIQSQFNRVLFDESEFHTITEHLLILVKHMVLLTELTTRFLGIKLLALILTLPLFALAITVGLIDGLNQRAIRTASLGRESTYVFHQLNRYFKKTVLLILALWLLIPASIKPAYLFIPTSLLLGVMAFLASSRFKKYW